MAENSIAENYRPGLTWPKIIRWWQVIRLSLIWGSFSLTMSLAFLAILTVLDGVWLFFGGNGSVTIVLATSIVLLFSPYLRRWSQTVIDLLVFPDTAVFKREITEACRALVEIDNRPDLQDFLDNHLPVRLQVDKIALQEGALWEEPDTLKFPLEMGDRSLGILAVGPKCSGRSFNREELLALNQLQEQVSLVLSVIQLAEAREAAERTDQLKSNFLTNISHELKTPLNSVINLTGLVADETLGPVTVEQAEYLNRAESGSEYLMKLLDDILDITRIETGQLTLQCEIIDLREVIEAVWPMAQGMLKHKPVQLRSDIADNLPLVMADRLRVRQILLNLLSNAVKFTKEGFILVKAWPERGQVYVTVQDTGIGIAPEDLPLIFEDYQQVLRRGKSERHFTRRRHFGTGLGMPITQALIALHGGGISVKSELDQGSIFTFTLLTAQDTAT